METALTGQQNGTNWERVAPLGWPGSAGSVQKAPGLGSCSTKTTEPEENSKILAGVENAPKKANPGEGSFVVLPHAGRGGTPVPAMPKATRGIPPGILCLPMVTTATLMQSRQPQGVSVQEQLLCPWEGLCWVYLSPQAVVVAAGPPHDVQ